MINKEMLAQFIYKAVKSTEKLFTRKNVEIYYSLYIEERWWVRAQILFTDC